MRRVLVPLLLLLMALTACSAREATIEPGASASGPIPGESAPPPAPADGTDLSACFDGSCSVSVTPPAEIELDGEAGPKMLVVTEIDGGSVRVESRERGAMISFSVSAGCRMAFSRGGGVSYCGPARDLGMEGVEIEIVSVTGDSAVLTLSYL